MTTGTRASFQRAIDRARDFGGARNATTLGGGRYMVVGRRGDRYTVAVDRQGEYSCTCPAGAQGNPCWHQASVWLRRLGEAASVPALPPRLAYRNTLAEQLADLKASLHALAPDDGDPTLADLIGK